MSADLICPETQGDDLQLVEIDVHNYVQVLKLKPAEGQQRFVASNTLSLVQGHYHPGAWFRAVYMKGEPVGFVMLYNPRCESRAGAGDGGPFDPEGKVPDDGLFIWRLMIDRHHQGRGIGRRLIARLAEIARANGFARLYLSYEDGEGGPGPFYSSCGFVNTGRLIEDEIEARLDLA